MPTLVIVDNTHHPLNQEGIRRAVQPLLAKGLSVGVYFVRNGNADDFKARLHTDISSSDYIALYTVLNTQYSAVAWSESIGEFVSNLNVRRRVMKVHLRTGQYTLAFVRSLEDIDSALSTFAGQNNRPPLGMLLQTIFTAPIVDNVTSFFLDAHNVVNSIAGLIFGLTLLIFTFFLEPFFVTSGRVSNDSESGNYGLGGSLGGDGGWDGGGSDFDGGGWN